MLDGLRHAIEHLGHHLPGQAPLALFVHHNTLHGDQHLGFERAVADSAKRSGASGYLSETSWRAHLASGRILSEELSAALEERVGVDALDALVTTLYGRPVTVRTVRFLSLLHDLGAVTPERLTWERTHGTLLTELAPGVDDVARARFLQGREVGVALDDAWRAVCDVLGLDATPAHPEDAFGRGLAGQAASERAGGPQMAREALDHVRQRLDALQGSVGVTVSHLMPWEALSGIPLEPVVQDLLIRRCAGFIDEGVASWSTTGRQEGLWTWFRRAEQDDRGLGPMGLGSLVPLLAGAPADPVEAVAVFLDRLGVPMERAHGDLERTALRLPGWSGMAGWHDANPAYPAHARRPYDLASFLAVRLALEIAAIEGLAAPELGIRPTLPALWVWCQHHPLLAGVRLGLARGELPDGIDAAARALASDDDVGAAGVARHAWLWHHLPGGPGMGRRLGAEAVPLFRLLQYVGAGGQALRDAGPSAAQALLEALNAFGERERGPVWLAAYEANYRNQVLHGLWANRGRGAWATRPQRPRAQIAFCIDDREEGFRRHLEAACPDLETLGVAGFFGVAMRYQGLLDRDNVPLCPVVIDPVHLVREEALVDAGPVELPLRDRMLSWIGVKPVVPVPTRLRITADGLAEGRSPTSPQLGFTTEEQADRVAATLRTMGLTTGLSRLVVMMGHGGTSRNNPHFAAYDCGACSGRHGGPNGRAFAAMANRPEVRALLPERGIHLPEDCWFVGAEHDTTSEACLWYDLDLVPASHADELARLRREVEAASARSAHERARKFASAPANADDAAALRHSQGRATDPFQSRPELGHATNASAIVGRRSLTRGLFLDRRAFLISYDPTTDPEGKVLEALLLAVGPVGAGINLEYYFSCVDNERYGCGTKVVHNVVGLIGVMAGGRGDLRTGLPRQMIEVHEPMRLLLVVEARTDILAGIYGRQAPIRELLDGGWLILVGIDPDTGAAARFVPGTGFVPWTPPPEPLPEVAVADDWYRGTDATLPPALIAHEVRHG